MKISSFEGYHIPLTPTHSLTRARSRKQARVQLLTTANFWFKTKLCNNSVLFNQGICVFFNRMNDDDKNYARFV